MYESFHMNEHKPNMYATVTCMISLTAAIMWSSALLMFSNSNSSLVHLYESSLLPWKIILFLSVISPSQ